MLLGAHRAIVTSDLDILNEVYVKQFHTFQARMIHLSVAVDQENGPQMNIFLGQGNRWKRLRAKKIWGKDATEFNPDRFLPENNENCHPMAWLSFGAGLRICLGKN
uniref:Cytochrome P450 n=1 Tax=Panagrolaimus davidi TaxID=227884 RepID=A0A914Q9L3_9BILA